MQKAFRIICTWAFMLFVLIGIYDPGTREQLLRIGGDLFLITKYILIGLWTNIYGLVGYTFLLASLVLLLGLFAGFLEWIFKPIVLGAIEKFFATRWAQSRAMKYRKPRTQ